MRRALPTALLGTVALGLSLGAGACGDGTVRVDLRPDEGATFRYEVRITTESETVLAGGPPQVRTDDVLLVAEHTVLGSSDGGVRVEVVLAEPDGQQRSFEVTFDRGAQLESIAPLDGASNGALGDLGLAELFPAAAAGPPDRRLAPGDRWQVDALVDLDGAGTTGRLSGDGHLIELGVVEGRDVARIESEVTLPVRSVRPSPDGELLLDGTQVTEQRATRDLADGSVRRATSTTVGRYDLTVSPPAGTTSPPVTGTLRVTVTSETRRVD